MIQASRELWLELTKDRPDHPMIAARRDECSAAIDGPFVRTYCCRPVGHGGPHRDRLGREVPQV